MRVLSRCAGLGFCCYYSFCILGKPQEPNQITAVWNYPDLKACAAQSLPSATCSPFTALVQRSRPGNAVQGAAAALCALKQSTGSVPRLAARLPPLCFVQSPSVKTCPSFVSEFGARRCVQVKRMTFGKWKLLQPICFLLPESRGTHCAHTVGCKKAIRGLLGGTGLQKCPADPWPRVDNRLSLSSHRWDRKTESTERCFLYFQCRQWLFLWSGRTKLPDVLGAPFGKL